MITYVEGDLFNSPAKYLAHACNCKGVWGSGIAVDFKKLFPLAYELYQEDCRLLGECLLGSSRLYLGEILCLFTSNNYGNFKDAEDKILKNTSNALYSIQNTLNITPNEIIAMPKINSGRFGVPWHKTEKVINEVLPNYNIIVNYLK